MDDKEVTPGQPLETPQPSRLNSQVLNVHSKSFKSAIAPQTWSFSSINEEPSPTRSTQEDALQIDSDSSIIGGYPTALRLQEQSTRSHSSPSIFGRSSSLEASQYQSSKLSSVPSIFGPHSHPSQLQNLFPQPDSLPSIFGRVLTQVKLQDQTVSTDTTLAPTASAQNPPSEHSRTATSDEEHGPGAPTATTEKPQHLDPQLADNEESEAEEDVEDEDDAPEELSPEDAFFAEIEASRSEPSNALPKRSIRDLGIIINSKLRARQQVAQRGHSSAGVDHDDSGTYDPKLEGRAHACGSERIAKRARVAGCGSNGDGGVARGPKERSAIPVGYGFPMTFRLTSEEGLAYLRSITPDGTNSSNRDADDKLPFGPSDAGYAIRRQTKAPKRLIGEQRDDGLTVDNLTLGHPQRRGCKSCFEAGDDECSLITDPLSYPCEGCDDSLTSCELILPPALKKVCERCKSKRIACSYRNDQGKGVRTCEQCAEYGETCIAGPLKSALMTSRRIDDVLAAQSQGTKVGGSSANRRYVSCHACRSSGQKCSLKRGEDGPCRLCASGGTECTFESTKYKSTATTTTTVRQESYRAQLKRQGRERKQRARKIKKRQSRAHGKHQATSHKASKRLRSSPSSTSTTSSLERQTSHDDVVVPTRTVKSCFSYPITFNWDPSNKTNSTSSNNSNSCHWCSSPFFGLCGYGELEVQLLDTYSSNTRTWTTTELAGGHASQGRESSNMCISCTFTRVRIMSCSAHTITAIPDTSPTTFNHHALYTSLAAYADGDLITGVLAKTTPWCSICPAPAFYKCSTKQMFDDEGQEIKDGCCVEGCGLLVCEACADLHERLQRGYVGEVPVLDRLLEVAESGALVGEYENRIRADAGLLGGDGELMRVMKWIAEMDVGEAEGVGNEDGVDREMETNDETVVESQNDNSERDWGVADFRGARSRGKSGKKGGSRIVEQKVDRKWKGKAMEKPITQEPVEYMTEFIVIDGDD